MSFRMFIQPLTEKTENEPMTHELMINTSTADFSMKDSKGSYVSPTRKIKTDTAIMEQLLESIDVVSDEVSYNIRKLDQDLKKESTSLAVMEDRIKELKNLNKDIEIKLNKFKSSEMSNFNSILALYKMLDGLVAAFADIIPDMTSLERRSKHYYYLKKILLHNKNQLEKDVTAINKRFNEAKKLVNTKQDKKEYLTYVNNLEKEYNKLAKSSKIDKFSFKYVPPENGH